VDEYYEEFLNGEDFAPAIHSQPVDPAIVEHYRDILPDRLLGYWQAYGFCGYADGLFWTVNPGDYEDLLQSWLEKTPLWEREKYHVIARNAFGKLYAWGEHSQNDTVLEPHYNTIMPVDMPQQAVTAEQREHFIGVFFDGKNQSSVDFYDMQEKRLFQPALQKLGALEHDEMYSFTPALALGGVASLDNLEIVKLQEQLALLIEMDNPQVLKTVGQLFQ